MAGAYVLSEAQKARKRELERVRVRPPRVFTQEQIDAHKASARACYLRNKELYNFRGKERYAADPSRHAKLCAAWVKDNKEQFRAARLAWKAANPQAIALHRIRRRAAELQRTAPWELDFTNFVTTEAAHLCKLREKATGIKWHVDHVVPLMGKNVCGLHVWNNLAVIPAITNLQKGRKWEM